MNIARAWLAILSGLAWHTAQAGEYSPTGLERAVVDMKPKDCLGNPLPPPPTVQVSDFIVTARDLESQKVNQVPLRLTHYDASDGTAEILFPFRKGLVYEVDLAPAVKKNHPQCPGKPVATE